MDNLLHASLQQIIADLKTTTATGLSDQEAVKRLRIYHQNSFGKKDPFKEIKLFLHQFYDPLVITLIIATIISYVAESKFQAIVIGIILLFNAFLGFLQELKAEKTMESLQKQLRSSCLVLRDSTKKIIPSTYLVPGDIVLFTLGDVIEADCRIITCKNVMVNEAFISGESVPVEKTAIDRAIDEQEHQITSPYLLYAGSTILAGSGSAVVIATGKERYINKIAEYTEKHPITRFQKNMFYISLLMLKIAGLIACGVFFADILLGRNMLETALFILAIMVGVTPELLPTTIRIALSKGALRMAQKKMLVKNLQSIENLGNMNILCSDKTGTLTEGNLQLARYVDLSSEDNADTVLLYGMLTNASGIVQLTTHAQTNNPYDAEIIKAMLTQPNVVRMYEGYELVDMIEFDFFRRKISCLVARDGHQLMITRGSPDTIISDCTAVMLKGSNQPITDATKKMIDEKMLQYEQDGYRVLAVASKTISAHSITPDDEQGLTLDGFLMFKDPVKKTALLSIEKIKELEVSIKILTGDSPILTEKICADLGFVIHDNKIVIGQEFAALSPEDKKQYALTYNVFARVNPDQKHEIIELLQAENNTVGFLADGINDTPAILTADVGITVQSAVQIAKKVSDIILLHKDLSIIADGIIEGRRSFINVTKYIVCMVSSTIGNIIMIATTSVLLPFQPMFPIQILLINVWTDTPLLMITTDTVEHESLARPQAWEHKNLFRLLFSFGIISCLTDILFIGTFLYVLQASPDVFRSGWFMLSCLTEIVIIFSLRTEKPFFMSTPSGSLMGISALMIALLPVLPYTPLGRITEIYPLSLAQYCIIILITALYFGVNELVKRKVFNNFYAE